MPLDTTSPFATVIQDHLELGRRNAALEHEMPLQKYMPHRPYEDDSAVTSEEHDSIEDTLVGVPSILHEPPSTDPPAAGEVQSASARVRDFDWGD